MVSRGHGATMVGVQILDGNSVQLVPEEMEAGAVSHTGLPAQLIVEEEHNLGPGHAIIPHQPTEGTTATDLQHSIRHATLINVLSYQPKTWK